MPSLSKMPLAARNLVTNLFGFLQSNQNNHNNLNEKSNKFSTPQVDRKNKVNLDRRNSDSKVPPEKMTKRVHIQNVEKWEPNVYEKELLRRTWSDEFDFLYELGSAIYFYIFEHNPNCKMLFPFIDRYEAENKNWKESKEFRGQALRFVQTLSQVVKNLYHMDRLEPYLYQIGQRHCKYADRGFKHEYWDIFQDAMENSLADRMNSLTDLDTQQKSDAITDSTCRETLEVGKENILKVHQKLADTEKLRLQRKLKEIKQEFFELQKENEVSTTDELLDIMLLSIKDDQTCPSPNKTMFTTHAPAPTFVPTTLGLMVELPYYMNRPDEVCDTTLIDLNSLTEDQVFGYFATLAAAHPGPFCSLCDRFHFEIERRLFKISALLNDDQKLMMKLLYSYLPPAKTLCTAIAPGCHTDDYYRTDFHQSTPQAIWLCSQIPDSPSQANAYLNIEATKEYKKPQEYHETYEQLRFTEQRLKDEL
ncbi:hypothetical protein WR25_04246 [Diploscapter pachys]|uniref:Globin domain-containing protein n=1 Tax=Diploscapter pachys TaxID=2018661 RepID=A0A2A2K1S6_9BILA|nr:hypothetical protein WR25_04246 [Diploscapter pachys]